MNSSRSLFTQKKKDRGIAAILRPKTFTMYNLSFPGAASIYSPPCSATQAGPFYQSTQFLFLDHLKKEDYTPFIIHHFTKSRKKIDLKSIEEIIEWTKLHTFYVQLFCHKVFLRADKLVDPQLLANVKEEIFEENEPYFISYKNLLTDQQWNLLKAIAKEGEVHKINQKNFLNTHHLSASTVQRSIKALEEREMIVHENDAYRVYDVFLGRWLSEKY